MSESPCPKCSGEMTTGFLFDREYRSFGRPLLWMTASRLAKRIEGRPGNDEQFEVDALRCVSCGYLELYAGLGDPEDGEEG